MQGELFLVTKEAEFVHNGSLMKGALGQMVKFWGRQAVRVACVVRAENMCKSVM